MIIVMGLPGAGKTTVLKGLDTDYRVQNFGDLMFEIEKEKFGITDRDQMRTISKEKQGEVQKLVYERLSKEKGKFILDTHCSVNTPKGFLPGVPFEYLKMLKVDYLVLITADVEAVAKRRSDDPSRKRDADNIGLHDQMNKSFLAAYSAFTGAPAVVIINEQGKAQEATARLQALLE
ncbi:MAG: AAA family ATPase [Candidatus Micrarchaeota archaeon]